MVQEMFLRKIPEDMRPWECNVNGVKYVYPAGTEQNVPAEVAALIDAYWEKQAVDYPETGISFNDLRDRPFGESTEVLFDQRVEILSEELMIEGALPISDGDLVKVTWDGAEYECTAGIGANGLAFFGNTGFMGGEDNGIPFAMATGTIDGQEMFGIIAPYFVGQTVSVKVEGLVVKTIDPKYLPESGAGFNVNVWYDSDAFEYVSDKTYEQIKAAEEAKTPIVGTLTLYDGKVFTMIGCDVALPTVNLVAFNLNNTPEIGVYHVSIDDNFTNIAFWSITATESGKGNIYPK